MIIEEVIKHADALNHLVGDRRLGVTRGLDIVLVSPNPNFLKEMSQELEAYAKKQGCIFISDGSKLDSNTPIEILTPQGTIIKFR